MREMPFFFIIGKPKLNVLGMRFILARHNNDCIEPVESKKKSS